MPESPLLILVSCSPGAPSPIILVASVQGHARLFSAVGMRACPHSRAHVSVQWVSVQRPICSVLCPHSHGGVRSHLGTFESLTQGSKS